MSNLWSVFPSFTIMSLAKMWILTIHHEYQQEMCLQYHSSLRICSCKGDNSFTSIYGTEIL
jgi:hypothetical protein